MTIFSAFPQSSCTNPNYCKDYQYTKCVTKENKSPECLCEDLPYIERVYDETPKGLRMQICRVKKDMCNDPDFRCEDQTNTTCLFKVEKTATGDYNALTFCTCKNSKLILADRSLTCERKFIEF